MASLSAYRVAANRSSYLIHASLLTIGLLALPASAGAIDFSSDTTQYITDPSFLPQAGQIYSDSGYNHFWVNSTFQSPNFPSYSGRTDTDQFTQQFWYGITDQLSFSASDSYQMTSGVKQFTNPKIALTYRAVEQSQSPVSMDIDAIYYPPAVTTIEAGGLAFHVSREMKSVTLQIEANAIYYDTGSDYSRYWTYLAGLRSQWRFFDHLGLNGGVVYSRRTDISNSQIVSNQYSQSTSYQSTTYGGSVTPYVGLSYDVWPTHATVAIEYQHSFLGDVKQSGSYSGFSTFGGPFSGAYSSSTVDRNEDFFALDVIFLF